jgi:hypothetical protein
VRQKKEKLYIVQRAFSPSRHKRETTDFCSCYKRKGRDNSSNRYHLLSSGRSMCALLPNEANTAMSSTSVSRRIYRHENRPARILDFSIACSVNTEQSTVNTHTVSSSPLKPPPHMTSYTNLNPQSRSTEAFIPSPSKWDIIEHMRSFQIDRYIRNKKDTGKGLTRTTKPVKRRKKRECD